MSKAEIIASYLRRQSLVWLVTHALALTITIGLIDYFTGNEVTVDPFSLNLNARFDSSRICRALPRTICGQKIAFKRQNRCLWLRDLHSACFTQKAEDSGRASIG
jgi:hypothetical protein